MCVLSDTVVKYSRNVKLTTHLYLMRDAKNFNAFPCAPSLLVHYRHIYFDFELNRHFRQQNGNFKNVTGSFDMKKLNGKYL
jgi:hypothetical protein